MIIDNLVLNEINRLNNVKTKYIDDLMSFSIDKNKYNISIFSMNIRSINCNFDELVLMLSSMEDSFDILVLSETWLLVDFNFVLNSYNIIRLVI